MKKTLFLSLVLIVGFTTQMFAMSLSNIRSNARFLSDRMAYELDLTPEQYDDCYEINYDFIYEANRIMDDVAMGYNNAIGMYYDILDARNEDLRYVLSNYQYTSFLAREYFYRPIYTSGRRWYFRIHTIYNNHNFYYYDTPRGYGSYSGGHRAIGHYNSRYHHEIYRDVISLRRSQDFHNHSRNDFGTVRRDHNDRNGRVYNDYRNTNQSNRTQDPRYRDRSGNRFSPEINRRNGSIPTPRQERKEQMERQNKNNDNNSTTRENRENRGNNSTARENRENRGNRGNGNDTNRRGPVRERR